MTISTHAGSRPVQALFPSPVPRLSWTLGWICPRDGHWEEHPQLQEPKQASPRQSPEPHWHAQGPRVPTPAFSAPSLPPHTPLSEAPARCLTGAGAQQLGLPVAPESSRECI